MEAQTIERRTSSPTKFELENNIKGRNFENNQLLIKIFEQRLIHKSPCLGVYAILFKEYSIQ